MERRWITPKECAKYLSIHVKTVYAQIARKEIPASRIGGNVRVDIKRLDQIMEARELLADDQIKGLGLR